MRDGCANRQLEGPQVQVNHVSFRRDGALTAGAFGEGRRVANGAIQFTVAARSLLLARGAGQALIILCYGLCHNWE